MCFRKSRRKASVHRRGTWNWLGDASHKPTHITRSINMSSKAIKSRSAQQPGADHKTAFIGSGNVFDDLGRRDAAEALAKVELAYRIHRLIDESRLTQAQAAKRLGIDQPKISNLVRGRLKDFSIE